MKYLLILLLTFTSLFVQGQYDSPRIGNIIVHKDARFDLLAEKQAEINKRAQKYVGIGIRSGYRIQVISTQNRDEANNIKAEMLKRFPDQRSYLLYQAPNFKVRVGNYLTQKEAGTLRSMIASLYSQRGIYIVPDRIEYRPQIEDEEQ